MNWSEYNLRNINCINNFFVFDILLENRHTRKQTIIHVMYCGTFECMFGTKANHFLSLPIKNVIIDKEGEYYSLTILFDSPAKGELKAFKCCEIIIENCENHSSGL